MVEPKTLAQLEAEHIQSVYESEAYNVTRTAKLLGIDRRTLHRKLAALQLPRPGRGGVGIRSRLAMLEAEVARLRAGAGSGV